MFSANLFLPQLRGATVLAIGASPVCDLSATGNPQHLAIARQVNERSHKVNGVGEKLDELTSRIKTSHCGQAVVDQVRQKFVIDGVASVALRDVDSKIAGPGGELELEVSILLRFP